MERLEPGTQIIFTPVPADKKQKLEYPGAQPGFIVYGPVRRTAFGSMDSYFVRYWVIKDGYPVNDLRTKAGAELTSVHCLIVEDTVPQEWVEDQLKLLAP